MSIKIAPSLVSAPLVNLGQVVEDLEAAGADILHLDVEDGSFVPEMNLGVRIIRELRPLTRLPFEVHLMMYNPDWLIPRLAGYADMISVHFEACPYPRRTLGLIKHHGLKAGLAFNPKTPLPCLAFCQPLLDYVLILSTEPESDQCPYLPSTLDKIRSGRQQNISNLTWIIDGGITADNIREAAAAGADIAVAGRGVFAQGDILGNIAKMRQALSQD